MFHRECSIEAFTGQCPADTALLVCKHFFDSKSVHNPAREIGHIVESTLNSICHSNEIHLVFLNCKLFRVAHTVFRL